MTVKNSEVYAVNKLNGRKSHVIQKPKPTWQLNHKSVFEVILDWENICTMQRIAAAVISTRMFL